MRKIAAFIASFLLFAGLLKAADVEFTVSAPKVVDASEQFAVTFSLNAKPGKNIIFPKFNDFVILGGPSQSSSSSISIINNKVTQSVTHAYTFYLQPQKAGTFSVSSAVAEVDGKVYTSRQFTIEVVGSGGAAAQQRPQQGADKSTQAVTTAEGDELFLKVLVDKSSVYAGEKITATIKIYSRVAIAGSEEEKYPSFAGFFKQDLPTPQLRQLERENVNGEIWYSGVLKRMVLYPQKMETYSSIRLKCNWWLTGWYKVQDNEVFGMNFSIRVPPISKNANELKVGRLKFKLNRYQLMLLSLLTEQWAILPLWLMPINCR